MAIKDLTPDEIAATLSLITNMSEGLMPQMETMEDPMGGAEMEGSEMPEMPEMTPGQEMPQEMPMMPQAPEEPQGDPVLEVIEALKAEGMSKAKVKKAMNQMIDETYAKES